MSTEQLAPRAVAEAKANPAAFRFDGTGQDHADIDDWAASILRDEGHAFRNDRAVFSGDCRGVYLPDGTLIAAGDWIIRHDGQWYRSVNGRTPAHAELVERVEYAIELREPAGPRESTIRFHGEPARLAQMLADDPDGGKYRIVRIDVTEVVTEIAAVPA